MANIQDGSVGRTSLGPTRPIKEKTSNPFSKRSSVSPNRMPRCLCLKRHDGPTPTFTWETDGALRGEFSTLSFGEHPISLFHNGDGESRLWQILEEEPHPKYYLSGKACRGILTRAERRQKEIPALLKATLEMQAEREWSELDGTESQNRK